MNISKSSLFSLVILFFALSTITSCTDKSKLVVGTWRIEDLKYKEAVTPEMKPVTDNWVNMMKSSYSITYRADGTYTATLNNSPAEGKWKLNWNSTAMTSTGPDNQPKTFQVEELDNEKFAFRVDENGQEVTFVLVRK
ncbi:MAG: hypothetical protein U0V74_17530 [Chitinophagales bacterium]